MAPHFDKTTQELDKMSIFPFGHARFTVDEKPRSDKEVQKMTDYFKATVYLCLGMTSSKTIPSSKNHSASRTSSYHLDAIFISRPGHGAPAVLSNSYLEGVYTEVYPDKSKDEEGMKRFFKHFSFPKGIGSHAIPETPGREIGYSISHAFGINFDHPDLIALTMASDDKAETGPLVTS